jgi:hypothetical protein
LGFGENILKIKPKEKFEKMEGDDMMDNRLLNILKSGASYFLDSKSGVPYEDLYQYLYIQNEKSHIDQNSQKSIERINFLTAVQNMRNLTFHSVNKKRMELENCYGLICFDEGVSKNHVNLIIRLFFGEHQAKTKTMLEQIIFPKNLKGELLDLSCFINAMHNIIMIKE